jgi:hypothetical protein
VPFVILNQVTRSLKLAGDWETWYHWQCARSHLFPSSPAIFPPHANRSPNRHTDILPAALHATLALPLSLRLDPGSGGRNENHMSGFANLIPLFIFGLVVYAFFRWVARDTQNPRRK